MLSSVILIHSPGHQVPPAFVQHSCISAETSLTEKVPSAGTKGSATPHSLQGLLPLSEVKTLVLQMLCALPWALITSNWLVSFKYCLNKLETVISALCLVNTRFNFHRTEIFSEAAEQKSAA